MYHCIVRVVKYMYKKTYLSFRLIIFRPLCQIKQRDQTEECVLKSAVHYKQENDSIKELRVAENQVI